MLSSMKLLPTHPVVKTSVDPAWLSQAGAAPGACFVLQRRTRRSRNGDRHDASQLTAYPLIDLEFRGHLKCDLVSSS